MADTARSASALKAFFLTGETPTQQQFADFITSYENIVDGNLLVGNDSAITAVYPASQSTAYAITKKTNNVQVSATGLSGVKLPQAKAGMICSIFDNGSNAINVYPLPFFLQKGESISSNSCY